MKTLIILFFIFLSAGCAVTNTPKMPEVSTSELLSKIPVEYREQVIKLVIEMQEKQKNECANSIDLPLDMLGELTAKGQVINTQNVPF